MSGYLVVRSHMLLCVKDFRGSGISLFAGFIYFQDYSACI